MLRPKESGPDEKVIPGSNHTPALAFDTIRNKIRAVMAAWSRLEGFTYSPKSALVFDVRDLREALILFRELIRGGRHFLVDQPIYLIAITHHASTGVDDVLKNGYETIAGFSN